MNSKNRLRRVEEDADDDDDDDDDYDDYEGILNGGLAEFRLLFLCEASSGRRVAARDSRAGEEDWTKRKKQNKTSKAEAEEQKSVRRPRAERVEAGLQRRK